MMFFRCRYILFGVTQRVNLRFVTHCKVVPKLIYYSDEERCRFLFIFQTDTTNKGQSTFCGTGKIVDECIAPNLLWRDRRDQQCYQRAVNQTLQLMVTVNRLYNFLFSFNLKRSFIGEIVIVL